MLYEICPFCNKCVVKMQMVRTRIYRSTRFSIDFMSESQSCVRDIKTFKLLQTRKSFEIALSLLHKFVFPKKIDNIYVLISLKCAKFSCWYDCN